jgi:hypothetical protein
MASTSRGLTIPLRRTYCMVLSIGFVVIIVSNHHYLITYNDILQHSAKSTLTPVDDNSPYIRLYSANEFWIPDPGAEAVRCHLQTMPTRCPGRREGVPIPAYRGSLSTLRRAAKVLALRGVPGPAKQPCIETSTQAGELSVTGGGQNWAA